MLPLVILAAHDEGVLLPDDALRELEPCSQERLAEQVSGAFGMEHVDRCALTHVVFGRDVEVPEEVVEALVVHVVVEDVALYAVGLLREVVVQELGFVAVVDVVGRVRYDQICLCSVHQFVHVLLLRAVAAQQTMVAEDVYVTPAGSGLVYGLVCGLCVEVVLLWLGREVLVHVKAEGSHVEADAEFLQQVLDLCLVPQADGLVQRHVRGLLGLLVHVDHDDVQLLMSLLDEDLVALVSSDDVAGALVPDDRVYVSELLDAALDVLVLRISGLQVNPGVVGCGVHPVDADSLSSHFLAVLSFLL